MCVLNVEKKLSVNIQVKTSSILRAISSEMLSSPFRSFATVESWSFKAQGSSVAEIPLVSIHL